MQRHQEGLSEARRRTLSFLSWLALAGSLTSSALAVQAWREEARPVALAAPAAPSVAAPPPAVTPTRPAPVRLPAPTPIRELQVLGIVRSEEGGPVAGARVRAGRAAIESTADGDGGYALPVPVFEGEAPMLYFSAAGYEPEEVALRPSQLVFEAIQLDVTLAPEGSRTAVTGVLRGPRGEPVSGETAQLQAPALRALHAAVSDAGGAFSIPGVRVGGRYDLVIRPQGPYADYWQRGLTVPADGLALEVELEALETQRLEGRIVDAGGRAVPGFALSLRSEGSAGAVFEVQGDRTGRFTLDDVPSGTLHAATHTAPHHVIRGISTDRDGRVEIVVDVGDRSLEGRVLDGRGAPLAGVPLDLAWLHRSGAVRSSSIRRGVSGRDGAFRFEGLGPGPHQLIAGDEPRRILAVAPGSGPLEVRLDPAPR